MNPDIEISEAEISDTAEIARIEAVSFADPWSLQSLSEPVCADTWTVLCARSGGHVCGYAYAVFAADEADIANIAVAPDTRRHGMGEALLLALLSRLSARGITRFWLEVRESNAAARELYGKCGFSECGRRRRYYRFPVEDGIIMVKEADPRCIFSE